MATAMRESFLLPSIKCSVCNADVEISLMGDHVCSSSPPTKEPTAADFPMLKSKPNNQSQKPTALPRIDPAAANKPFTSRNQLTPSSSNSGSYTHSPATPRDGQPLRTPMNDNALLPKGQERDRNEREPRDNSPSVYNIDCPFPPFQSPVVSPTNKNFANPNFDSPTVPTFHYPLQVKKNLYSPTSPTTNGGQNVMARMNTIAPGPFGVGGGTKEKAPELLPAVAASFPERSSSRNPSVEPLPAVAAHFGEVERQSQVRRETHGTIRFGFEDLRPMSGSTIGASYNRRPSVAASDRSQSPEAWRSRKQEQEPVPALPPLVLNGSRLDDRLGPQSPKSPPSHRLNHSATLPSRKNTDNTQAPSRSQTFPEKLAVDAKPLTTTSRVPPHPGLGLPRKPSETKHLYKVSLSKALPPPPPEREPSPSATRDGARQSDLLVGDIYANARVRSPSPARPRSPPHDKRPPMRRGSPSKTNEYVAYSDTPISHSATQSMSSNASSTISRFSERSDSSMSSPPTSDISVVSKLSGPRFVPPQNASPRPDRDVSEIDGLMLDLRNSMKALDSSPPRLEINELYRSTPAQNNNQRQPSRGASPRRRPSPSEDASEMPSLMSPSFGSQPMGRPPVPAPTEALPARRPSRIEESRKQPPPALTPLVIPPRNTTPQPLPPTAQEIPRSKTTRSGHKRTLTSKGNCRGCDQPIVGKSISSADGRLTGRYHKPCFVCQACRAPFQSAEFYVMDNLPYCERHYHKLNHSLCPTCDRGIEGPCLETERQERFHPRCFACTQCRIPLGDDYFEVNGRPFCERHAYQYRMPPPPPRMGQNAPNRNMMPIPQPKVERRKTRTMFMDGDGIDIGGMDGFGGLPRMPGMDGRAPRNISNVPGFR